MTCCHNSWEPFASLSTTLCALRTHKTFYKCYKYIIEILESSSVLMIQIHSLADTKTRCTYTCTHIEHNHPAIDFLVEIMIHTCVVYRNRKKFLPGDLVLYWPSIWEDLMIVCWGHDSPTMEPTAENGVVCSGWNSGGRFKATFWHFFHVSSLLFCFVTKTR